MTSILDQWRAESHNQRIVSPAELAAMREADRPAVSKGCICGPPVEIDGEMYVVRCPSCEIPGHGAHSRYTERSALSTREKRRDGHQHSQHTISER